VESLKGIISKDMIESSGTYTDDNHTEEDLFEMFEILSYIHYDGILDYTDYEIALA
jgi:hypothetical protein